MIILWSTDIAKQNADSSFPEDVSVNSFKEK
jgi:hypothetical protein